MGKHIIRDLPELTAAGVITEETSERIRRYYTEQEQRSPNRMVIVFGILGALLVGLGIILIIAHNWDELSRPMKLFYSLLPLVLGQGVCAWTLLKKANSQLWREGGSVFLFFAIGASISMVSQVYNMPGELSRFLFTWMLLALPLVYVMRSSMTSLLVLGGITWYATLVSYDDYPTAIAWYYWLGLVALLPFYFRLLKEQGRGFVHLHSWFIALSIITTLGMFTDHDGIWMFVAYMSLFSSFVLVGETKWFADGKIINNAFLVTGSLGTTVLLLVFTFDFLWKEIARESLTPGISFAAAAVTSAVAAALLFFLIRTKGTRAVNPVGGIFLVFIFLFLTAHSQPAVAQWLTNVLVLCVALITAWRGAARDNFFVLNYGVLIMAMLILCRFFDTDLSFVVRGILFMAVGVSFFVANYWLLRKRKVHQV